ncbi:MAG: glycosyltransferase family 39 protein [Verrucomicrobiales bacterium]|nr:glycosyltransferase family 39 protein [Verrucomicrobiales bacterium]
MKSLHAISLILVIWAAIYLTHLGERELRGEEARRIIPAQEMIQTDQWVVPTLAGETYGNKPPLINWVIAASFLITGSESEFAARLPSVLSLLILSLTTFFVLRKELGVKKSVSVSLILLTAGSMIEKCRMAEIEAIFITLFGFACLSWIALWTAKKSPWLIWTIPYLFIGIACLAKGPVHLIFWILFLIPVLKSAGGLRQVFHPAHLLGLIIMASIALPWVFANLNAVEKPDESLDNWINELAKRTEVSKAALQGWATHPLEILINFLPWTVPLVFSLWCLRKEDPPPRPLSRWDAVYHGAFWSIVLTAIALLCIPGGLPRYILPLYVPASIAVVVLYFRVKGAPREAYERFAYKFLVGGAITLAVVIVSGTAFAISSQLTPLWPLLIFSLLVLGGCLAWLLRVKTQPGVFISTPIFVAAAYFTIINASIPFERTRYEFRDGAAEIIALTNELDSGLVFYADSDYRNAFPKHLRLLYYLGDKFTYQGESKKLPADTSFLIGREGSLPAMRELASAYRVEKTATVKVEEMKLEALYLSARED